jgi:hypothetical protein
MGIIPPTTQKISQMMQPSPIHSKRDRWTTSMWRRWWMNLMLWWVHFH